MSDMEWVVSKSHFFETETGRNLRDFYYEQILARDGKDREESIREWMETFDVIRVRVYPEEERICYTFLQEFGGIVDDHCEDIFPGNLTEIVADMESIIEGKPRHSWTPWRPEVTA
jgi:hypothetical protein